MNIIPTTKTAMLSDLRRQLTLAVAEATHHLAVVVSRSNQTVWNLSTDDLLAFLNADLSATKAMLENSHALATVANTSLSVIVASGFACRRLPCKPPKNPRRTSHRPPDPISAFSFPISAILPHGLRKKH